MLVTVAFLERVHQHLHGLARKLDQQEASVRRLIRSTNSQIDRADRHWRGPRANRVIDRSRTYLTDVEPYADAVAAAAGVTRRWSRAALHTSQRLARLVNDGAPPVTLICGGPRFCIAETPDMIVGDDEPTVRRRIAAGAVIALNEEWDRTCSSFAEQLDISTRAIQAVNEVTVGGVDAAQAERLWARLAMRNLRGEDAVRSFWRGLNDAQRLAVVTAHPWLLSSIDGIPPHIRRMARRTGMMNSLTRLERLDAEGDLSPEDRARMRSIRARLGALDGGEPDTHAGIVHLEAVAVGSLHAVVVPAHIPLPPPTNPPRCPTLPAPIGHHSPRAS